MHYKFLPSFVQRKGRITKSQEDNLNNLRSYQITSHSQILSEKDNFKEIILEIGFGNGESLVNLAKENPHNLYIGSEVYIAGIGQVLGAIRDNELTNIRLITGDIRLFLDEINQPVFRVADVTSTKVSDFLKTKDQSIDLRRLAHWSTLHNLVPQSYRVSLVID